MKPYTISAIVLMSILSCVPSTGFFISNPYNEKWLWMIMVVGFLGIFIIFLKTSWVVKIISVGGLVNCFFSCAPYISFTSYVSLVGCCYFYILCTKIEDWDLILKALQSILLLNLLIIVMSLFGKDPLMNFGLPHTEHFGVLGQHMQEASFIVIICAFLLSYNKLNFYVPFIISFICTSTWTFLSSSIGFFIWLYSKNVKYACYVLLALGVLFLAWSIKERKIISNMDKSSGRTVVWERSFASAAQRPWMGWGIGTYKEVFPPLSKLDCTPYKTAHNFIVELLFEIGFPLTIFIVFGLIIFGILLWNSGLTLLLSGLSMIGTDSLVHFPDRMIQTVLLIVAFLAYCKFALRRYA